MARAANIGGELRHPEIRSAAESAVWPQAAVIAKAFVIDNPWVWPAAEIFHFIGLCMIIGTVLVINLRLFGIINHVSFDSVYRLLPWGIAGFIINFISGMLFFVTVPDQYTQNSGFARKMVLMVIARRDDDLSHIVRYCPASRLKKRHQSKPRSSPVRRSCFGLPSSFSADTFLISAANSSKCQMLGCLIMDMGHPNI